jgi:hypothetical protein
MVSEERQIADFSNPSIVNQKSPIANTFCPFTLFLTRKLTDFLWSHASCYLSFARHFLFLIADQ